MAEARPTNPAELERLRRRTVATLVAGVALGSTGHIAAVTVATIVATHISGGAKAWSGAPTATVVLGAAAGAIGLSWVMVRRGRRFGLTAGYVVSVLGAILATAAVVMLSLPLLLIGTVLIGFGNASNQLSRYTAADLAPPDRRASAIGLVVWGATIGAVAGPNLVAPAGKLALALGLPELSGPYLVPIVFVGAAALLSFLLLRPDPYELADASSRHDMEGGDRSVAVSLASVIARPSVPVAIVALVTGQVVMVLIMTMTPLHMADHGHDLAAVGLVISGHTFGMFGLSPISGRLTDRFGSVPVILAGLARGRHRVAPRRGRATRGRGHPLRRAVPARLRLEPWVCRRISAADPRAVAGRADPRPGPDRRPDLELGRSGEHRFRGRAGVRGLRDPGADGRGPCRGPDAARDRAALSRRRSGGAS